MSHYVTSFHVMSCHDKICILDTFGFNRCRCRIYESAVKSFRPKKVLIVFRQYLSHLTCSRVHSCCVEIRIARHVTSCCVTSRRVMSRYVALCHVISRHVMSRHVTSCHIMPRDVPHVTSWHVMSRHVMSRHVKSCPVMSRHVISCYVISRRKSRDGHATNASLSTDFFHTQSIQIKHDRVRCCPEGCRYNTASAVYNLVLVCNDTVVLSDKSRATE